MGGVSARLLERRLPDFSEKVSTPILASHDDPIIWTVDLVVEAPIRALVGKKGAVDGALRFLWS